MCILFTGISYRRGFSFVNSSPGAMSLRAMRPFPRWNRSWISNARECAAAFPAWFIVASVAPWPLVLKDA
jgi:hypothetical protein